MQFDQLKRREFIGLLGGAAAAWPMTVRAQQPARLRRIGIIDDAPTWDHFRRGLRDLGHIEGRDITFEYRIAEGRPDRLLLAAAELASLPVDIIATFGTPASRAAKAATQVIPIVAISIGDPIAAGLVASLARPGGNVTGNIILGPDLVAKRLQILTEIVPAVSRLAFLWNPDNASNAAMLSELHAATATLGIGLLPVEVRRLEEFDAALSAMMKERPNAFLMTNDPFHRLHVARIIAFLIENRLPGMFQTRENVVAGGLVSYGANFPALLRRGAWYAHRILEGTRPADLPMEQPTKFELVVNLKAAKAVGLAISEAFLLRADEVIE